MKPDFPAVIVLDSGVNKQGRVLEAKSSVWVSSRCEESVRNPCQQTVTKAFIMYKI